MKIEGYTYKIDMTPKMVHVYIELPGEGEGKFITDERPEYTQEQKAEFENARAFVFAQIPVFLEEMKKVAQESYRVLKKDKFCAILMGDTRKKGCMVPMSFDVMKIFEEAGFTLKELIIKEQHNCRATGYWKTNSVKYNFLLIAHEYLFVFRK